MTTEQAPSDTGQTPPSKTRPRRKNWRLRVLLAVNALAFGLYVFVRLDRSTVEPLGPVAVGIYDVFNRVPGQAAPLNAAGRRLVEDVKALGGQPNVSGFNSGFFASSGQTEWADVSFSNREFNDAALARLAESHGDQIGGLSLQNTGVTDVGLKSLSKFTMLRHLQIHNYPLRTGPAKPVTRALITDAGLVNLKGLNHLWSLGLSDLPITDSGLAAINDLPELTSLYLVNTEVEGRGLVHLRTLPRLYTLQLDGSAMTEDGLKALSGAVNLRFLSLNGVPLTANALPLLKAIPRLEQLDITGCGFLDEEVEDLIESKPGLKVMRR